LREPQWFGRATADIEQSPIRRRDPRVPGYQGDLHSACLAVASNLLDSQLSIRQLQIRQLQIRNEVQVMGMFSQWLDNLAQRQFRKDDVGRSVFVPFGPRRPGYYVENPDADKIKVLVKIYALAGALINVVGSTATLAFTQSLVFDERSMPLRRKIEFGFAVYSIAALFLYVFPALLLWRVYGGLIKDLCSSLATAGPDSVRQMRPSSNNFPTAPLLVLIAISILILGMVLLFAVSRRP
jgi:hypothetical protein